MTFQPPPDRIPAMVCYQCANPAGGHLFRIPYDRMPPGRCTKPMCDHVIHRISQQKFDRLWPTHPG